MSCLRAIVIAITIVTGMDAAVQAGMVTVSSSIKDPTNPSDGTTSAGANLFDSFSSNTTPLGFFSFTLGTALNPTQSVGTTPVTFGNLMTKGSSVSTDGPNSLKGVQQLGPNQAMTTV